MQPALGSLTPPHRSCEHGACTGATALAMAVTALEPSQDPHTDLEATLYQAATAQDGPPDGADRELFPYELGLAALAQGLHARLKLEQRRLPYRQHLIDQGLPVAEYDREHERAEQAARAAGLMVTGGKPSEADVVRALEAGRPLLLLIDGAQRHEDLDPHPLWVVLVGLEDETLRLHDPRKPGGPEEGLLSRLPAVSGFQETYALLELAQGVHLAQRG